MITTTAIYEKGILRPIEPLNLIEGQTVQLRIDSQSHLVPLSRPTVEEEAFAKRIKASKTLEEMLVVLDTMPSSSNDFDVIHAINETRRQSGFRVPDPGS